MKCEDCNFFNGRDKYCNMGLWIGITDMRICSSHPEHSSWKCDHVWKEMECMDGTKKPYCFHCQRFKDEFEEGYVGRITEYQVKFNGYN